MDGQRRGVVSEQTFMLSDVDQRRFVSKNVVEDRHVIYDPQGDKAWFFMSVFLVLIGLVAITSIILLGVFIPKINSAKSVTDRLVDISDSTANSKRFHCPVVFQKTNFPSTVSPTQPFTLQWGTLFFDKKSRTATLRVENADPSLREIRLHGRWTAASGPGGATSLYTLYTRPAGLASPMQISSSTALGGDTAETGYGPIAERSDLYYLEATNDAAPGGVARAYLNCQYFP